MAKYCNECSKYHWNNEKCYPKYKVFYEEYMGDEPILVAACNHEDAALKFAEDYNTSNDYCLMNDNIEIKVEFENVIKYFKIGAEPDVHYSSEELEELSNN